MIDRRTRLVIALVALLVAAGVLWLATRAPREIGVAAPHSASAPAATPREDARLSDGVPSSTRGASSSDSTTVTAAIEPAAAASSERAALDAASLAPNALRIRVVAASTGLAEPGASAWWLPATDAEGSIDKRTSSPRLSESETWNQRGRRLVLDANGEAELPRDARGAIRVAAASAAGFAGHACAAGELELVVLRLARERSIEVHVQSHDGQVMADVPIALEDRSASARAPVRVRSDASGGATLAGLSSWLESARGPFRLGLALPLAPPIELEFDREHVPTEPVWLTLPPLASVHVTARLSTGRDADASTSARAPLFTLRAVAANGKRSALPAPSTPGWSAAFAHVQAGVPLALEGTLDEWEDEQVELAPLAVGETRDVDVVFDAPLPLVLARFVHEDGAPCATCKLELVSVESAARSQITETHDVSTDARGEMRLAQRRIAPGAARRLTFRDARRALVVHADLPAKLPPLLDLGTLVLAEPPFLIGGRVVDRRDRPIAGATVQPLVRVGTSANWTTDAGLEATSDEHGEFELHGELDAEELRLSAHAPHYLMLALNDAPPHRRGTRDVRIVLDGQAGIEGRLLLPDGTLPRTCSVHFKREGADAKLHWLNLQADGGFRGDALPAGRGVLLVCIGASTTPFAHVDDLELAAGETLRDPRLDPLDLSTAFTLVRFRVESERAEPLSGTLQRASAPDDDVVARAWSTTFDDGTVALPRVPTLERVLVRAKGYRDAEVELASAPSCVVLRDGRVIAFALPELALPREAALKLVATSASGGNVVIDLVPGARTEWRAPSDGRWNLECVLFVPAKPFPAREPLVLETKSIELGDALPTEIALRFDKAATEAVLARYAD